MQRKHASSGFTLVELMVTIAIVAILLALGLPSFQDSLRSNRIATSTNELMASLALARTDAIRSTKQAGVCSSTDGATCGGNWNDGWIVWTDANKDGAPTGETISRYVQAHPELSLATASGDKKILFDYRGRANAPQVFTLKAGDCPAGRKFLRTLAVTSVGQTNAHEGTCP